MKSTDTILASYTKTLRGLPSLAKSYGASNVSFRVVAQLHQLGDQKPYFSVTGTIWKGTGVYTDRSDIAGGCLHVDIAKYFPTLKPIIALHLSDEDGVPMHAEANSFYQLAGSVGHHFGEQYHGGNSERHFPITPAPETQWRDMEYRMPTKDECLTITAEYLRISEDQVRAIREEVIQAFDMGGNAAAKARWAQFVDTLRPQWKAEAEAGLALIRSLSAKPVTA